MSKFSDYNFSFLILILFSLNQIISLNSRVSIEKYLLPFKIDIIILLSISSDPSTKFGELKIEISQ
ncbi:hypothetical protein RhiirA5_422752 [Rhizophagus irregularis]|uniref:Uncharacterized protein n=1 Tax=Rhizophagus irregularis TaxID=588596 RepID=A0A2N0PBA7_9GLOM|nr:hypothetical protein RhiirA5_422752 [Rhizophagus irregularis]GET50659.1 hypothetical protein RIR_e34818_A0A2N0PBA7_9GLOM [Rhizophagus irregularis DAOM 181602=DAOM 197198]